MIEYPHFAVPNLYLVNGYEEVQTSLGLERSYDEPRKLELCVARVLLRKPQRLRGWDFRFLRRELGLSQAELGQLFGRDAQTIARWEKTKRRVPALADFVIRCRFAARYEPKISLQEVLSYVDGAAPKLPDRIMLAFDGNEWKFQLGSTFAVKEVGATADKDIRVPATPGPMEHIYTVHAKAFMNQRGLPSRKASRGAVSKNLVLLGAEAAEYVSIHEPSDKLHFSAKGSLDERFSETKH